MSATDLCPARRFVGAGEPISAANHAAAPADIEECSAWLAPFELAYMRSGSCQTRILNARRLLPAAADAETLGTTEGRRGPPRRLDGHGPAPRRRRVLSAA